MSSLWIASSVTTTNGSSLITVQSNEDIAGIRQNSLIQVGANPLMEVKRTFLSDSGVKTIELFEAWQFGAGTGQRAIAAPTLGEIKSLADDVRQLISSAEEIIETTNLNPAGGSIAKRTSDGRVKTANATEANDAVAYGQFDGLETELRGAVDQSIADNEAKFNQIETQGKFDENATLILDYANNDYRVYEQFKGKTNKFAEQIETFSRGSSKTGFTPTGLAEAGTDIPLNVIDPSTGEPLGRSIHEQRTNLLTYSEDFDNAAWDKGRALVTADQITSPGGAVTADKVEAIEPGAGFFVQQSSSITSGSSVSFSVYVKKGVGGNYTAVTLREAGGDYFRAWFDIVQGIVASTTSSGVTITNGSADIKDVGDGWYRVYLSVDTSSITGIIATYYISIDANGGFSYDAGDYNFVWGAQLEQGSFPTPYIPTQGMQVTRQADVCSIDNIDQSDWFNSSEGTFVVEWNGSSSNPRPVVFSDGTVLGRIGIYSAGADLIRIIHGNNGDFEYLSIGTISGDYNKVSFSFDSANKTIKASLNGGATVTLNVAADFVSSSLTKASIGMDNFAQTGNINGSVKYLKHTPKAVSDAQLQELSTL